MELLYEPEGKTGPGQIAEDDVSGEALDTSLARTARKEEIAYFQSIGVYRTYQSKRVMKWPERDQLVSDG